MGGGASKDVDIAPAPIVLALPVVQQEIIIQPQPPSQSAAGNNDETDHHLQSQLAAGNNDDDDNHLQGQTDDNPALAPRTKQRAASPIQALDEEDQDDVDELAKDVVATAPKKKQRIEPPPIEAATLSPSLSFDSSNNNSNMTEHYNGLVCLNVRGTKMDVPRTTLMEIPWFEALLTRWSHDGDSLTRDKEGNLYIDDNAELFRSLIHHARNVSRPSPLALCMTTPSFGDDNNKEQEFRLMVDAYGLTDVFYAFSWYQAEWVVTEEAQRCEITGNPNCNDARLDLPYSIEPWVNDKPHVIKSGNKHNRRITAFELTIGDASKLDWLDFGWMSEETRKAYKVRLNRPKVNAENGRRSIMYTCMEEDLNSVGETRMDKDSIEINLPDDAAGSALHFRLERERMKFSFHGTLFWSAGETPADDLVPWIYHCGEEGSAIEITKIELEH